MWRRYNLRLEGGTDEAHRTIPGQMKDISSSRTSERSPSSVVPDKRSEAERDPGPMNTGSSCYEDSRVMVGRLRYQSDSDLSKQQSCISILAAGFARALLHPLTLFRKRVQGRPGAGWHPWTPC